MGDNSPITERRALVAVSSASRYPSRSGEEPQLDWNHIEFSAQQIRWCADTDEKGKEWIIPATPALLNEIRTFQRHTGQISGWIFPAEENPDKAMDESVFNTWRKISEIKKVPQRNSLQDFTLPEPQVRIELTTARLRIVKRAIRRQTNVLNT